MAKVQKARELTAAGAWFLTVRVAEVAVIALLVGVILETRNAWTVGAQFAPAGSADVSPSLMQRITGMALFGGYRMPVSLLVVALTMAGLLVVLHRCQPVSHTRVLRWEWLTLWAVSALLALVASTVEVAALFGDDPYASPDPSVAADNFGPGFREQVVGNLSWPLGALLLLLPLALWWARLPDPDDIGATPDREAVPRREVELGREAELGREVELGRGVGGNVKFDSIVVDDVEQIEPVERLLPDDLGAGDGSSTSGYEGYFRRP